MATIKKYENRRLYDTGSSRYVNLVDVRRLIEAGEDVTVSDAKSGADRTREVLLQVLAEDVDLVEMLPARLLHRVIRAAGDDPVRRMGREQLRIGLEFLDAQIEEAQLLLVQMAEPGGPMFVAEPPGEPYVPAFENERPDPAWQAPAQGSEELEALRAELGRLEERLRR